jgi:hypothetical protein
LPIMPWSSFLSRGFLSTFVIVVIWRRSILNVHIRVLVLFLGWIIFYSCVRIRRFINFFDLPNNFIRSFDNVVFSTLTGSLEWIPEIRRLFLINIRITLVFKVLLLKVTSDIWILFIFD